MSVLIKRLSLPSDNCEIQLPIESKIVNCGWQSGNHFHIWIMFDEVNSTSLETRHIVVVKEIGSIDQLFNKISYISGILSETGEHRMWHFLEILP